MDDNAIVDKFLARDEAAIALTDERYGERLRKLAQSIVKDVSSAEECVNDAYMQAWSLIPPHEPRDYLYPFLARIVRHICLNICRQRSSLKRSAHIQELSAELEACTPSGEDIESRMSDAEFAVTLNAFLSALSEDARNIFIRRYWYLDSVADISKRFGMTQSKVKTTLFRCRKRLREYLEKEGYEL